MNNKKWKTKQFQFQFFFFFFQNGISSFWDLLFKLVGEFTRKKCVCSGRINYKEVQQEILSHVPACYHVRGSVSLGTLDIHTLVDFGLGLLLIFAKKKKKVRRQDMCHTPSAALRTTVCFTHLYCSFSVPQNDMP